MKYRIQAALLENSSPESEYHTDNLVDAKLLYKALRDAGHRPVRLIENGYWAGPERDLWVNARVLYWGRERRRGCSRLT